MKKKTINKSKYICIVCDYCTYNKKDYNLHIISTAHKNKIDNIPESFVCGCGTQFNRFGLHTT